MIIPELIQKYYNSQNKDILEFVRVYILDNVPNHQWQFFINKLEENRKPQDSDKSDLGIWDQIDKNHLGLSIRGKNSNRLVIERIFDSRYKSMYNIKDFTLENLQEAIKGFYKDSSK